MSSYSDKTINSLWLFTYSHGVISPTDEVPWPNYNICVCHKGTVTGYTHTAPDSNKILSSGD